MRTLDEILEEDYHVTLECNRRDESIKLAAEKYAQQYINKNNNNNKERTGEYLKEALRAAGQLALAAQSVISANMLNVSQRIDHLDRKLNEYNNIIINLGKKD